MLQQHEDIERRLTTGGLMQMVDVMRFMISLTRVHQIAQATHSCTSKKQPTTVERMLLK
jgi:hypothetical protein